MSKTIFLLRHAKSDWANMDLPDHDRPLNSRGKAAADMIGRYFAAAKFAPDHVYCSTARRAEQTLARIQAAGQLSWQSRPEAGLYGASAETLLKFIQGMEGAGGDSLMIIGHNPGLEDLVQVLSADDGPALSSNNHINMPTGCFVGIECKGSDFAHITEGQGKITTFMRPKHEFQEQAF